jgi:hypothetical protein
MATNLLFDVPEDDVWMGGPRGMQATLGSGDRLEPIKRQPPKETVGDNSWMHRADDGTPQWKGRQWPSQWRVNPALWHNPATDAPTVQVDNDRTPMSVALSGAATLQVKSAATLQGQGAAAANAQIIEQQLSYRLDEARRAARAFSQAFKDQAEELKKKNDRTPQFDDFVAFLEKMASGLSELADTLDRAFEAAGGSPEPIFLGKAGEIIRRLQLTAMEWLEKEKDTVIDISFRFSLFCSGMIFLHSYGIYDPATTGVLGGLVLKSGSKKSSDDKPQ